MHSGQPPGANLIASGRRPISPANHLNSATQLKNCPSENKPIYTHWFPPGYRFIPEDDELILHYLNNRIMNKPIPYSIIRDVELYKHNPKDLAENYSDNGINSWYFFTPRDRKYKNGSRPNRGAGDGYWKATGADKLIYYNNEVVGAKKALVFYKGKPPKGTKTSWIMQEYRVHQPPRVKLSEDDMRLDDWVLCRIYKKEEKSIPNKRQRINEDHVTELRQNDNELTQTKTNLEGMVCKENDFQEGNVLMNRFGNSLPSSHFDNTFADDHVLINSNYNFDCYDLASASFPCENSAFRSKYLQQEMASLEFEEDVLAISRDNFDLADDIDDEFSTRLISMNNLNGVPRRMNSGKARGSTVGRAQMRERFPCPELTHMKIHNVGFDCPGIAIKRISLILPSRKEEREILFPGYSQKNRLH
ncbi:NAC transcription factor 29-like [Olea europaea var. sylvestris]|uniref:NAC transcription factor 29-like n=1 Tax=Olea europaea var. sylvestris TaxID=158386 RepID=UPI000C1CF86F|nr:NAC transcription factor 29-like [Olea europaea var. sylvestris]